MFGKFPEAGFFLRILSAVFRSFFAMSKWNINPLIHDDLTLIGVE
jgi:hypothetical protein